MPCSFLCHMRVFILLYFFKTMLKRTTSRPDELLSKTLNNIIKYVCQNYNVHILYVFIVKETFVEGKNNIPVKNLMGRLILWEEFLVMYCFQSIPQKGCED